MHPIICVWICRALQPCRKFWTCTMCVLVVVHNKLKVWVWSHLVVVLVGQNLEFRNVSLHPRHCRLARHAFQMRVASNAQPPVNSGQSFCDLAKKRPTKPTAMGWKSWKKSNTLNMTRWWFQICFIFTPTCGNDPNLTNLFQMGWNHQLVIESSPFSLKYALWSPYFSWGKVQG